MLSLFQIAGMRSAASGLGVCFVLVGAMMIQGSESATVTHESPGQDGGALYLEPRLHCNGVRSLAQVQESVEYYHTNGV